MGRLDPIFWREFVGLSFKFRGRGPDSYDCYGLLMAVYAKRGIIIPDVLYGSSTEEVNDALVAHGNIKGWHPAECAPGIGVMFRRISGAASHVGVMIDDDEFIHATEDLGQVALSRLSRGYSKRVIGFYDYVV